MPRPPARSNGLRFAGARLTLAAAAVAAIAGCGSGVVATAPPSTSALATAVLPSSAAATPATAAATTAAATAASAADSTYLSDAFDVPFSIKLPAGWKIGVDDIGMFTAYLLTTGDIPDVGVDIQIVPVVHLDPCDPASGPLMQGISAASLAAWMLALTPLAATAGPPSTVDGAKALVIDEAFAGTPCLNLQLWSTPGGWVDEREQKRYFLFESSGRRLVATIFSTNERFASHVDAARAVLDSVTFLR